MIEEIGRAIAGFVYGTIFDGLILWLRRNGVWANTILAAVALTLLGFVLFVILR